ncbi:MAG: hypothetical protein ACLQDV_25355 [Candidatus Binataceae bacterium]
MSETGKCIKLQLLLNPKWRTPEGIAQVKRVAQSLGITPTVTGAASISAEMESGPFEKLFVTKATPIAARKPTATDFGTSGGFTSAGLAVPETLSEFVQSVTVAPPHIRMS